MCENEYPGLKENLERFKNDLQDEKTRLLFKIAYKQGHDAGQVNTLVTGTPISDKNNLSLKSDGDEDFERWIYEISLLLDKIIPVHGYTNAQRIEMAINEIKRQYQ